MAQNEFGEVLKLALFAGVAWVAWNLYEAYQLGASTTTAPATGTTSSTTTTPATPATPAATPDIVIPAGFTVAPDINNSYKGTVTYKGVATTFNVILANAGQGTQVVYNSQGQDVTALLGSADVTTLVNAFQAAVNQQQITGVSGFGQFIPVPPVLLARRVVPVPVRRRMEYA